MTRDRQATIASAAIAGVYPIIIADILGDPSSAEGLFAYLLAAVFVVGVLASLAVRFRPRSLRNLFLILVVMQGGGAVYLLTIGFGQPGVVLAVNLFLMAGLAVAAMAWHRAIPRGEGPLPHEAHEPEA